MFDISLLLFNWPNEQVFNLKYNTKTFLFTLVHILWYALNKSMGGVENRNVGQ